MVLSSLFLYYKRKGNKIGIYVYSRSKRLYVFEQKKALKLWLVLTDMRLECIKRWYIHSFFSESPKLWWKFFKVQLWSHNEENNFLIISMSVTELNVWLDIVKLNNFLWYYEMIMTSFEMHINTENVLLEYHSM